MAARPRHKLSGRTFGLGHVVARAPALGRRPGNRILDELLECGVVPGGLVARVAWETHHGVADADVDNTALADVSLKGKHAVVSVPDRGVLGVPFAGVARQHHLGLPGRRLVPEERLQLTYPALRVPGVAPHVGKVGPLHVHPQDVVLRCEKDLVVLQVSLQLKQVQFVLQPKVSRETGGDWVLSVHHFHLERVDGWVGHEEGAQGVVEGLLHVLPRRVAVEVELPRIDGLRKLLLFHTPSKASGRPVDPDHLTSRLEPALQHCSVCLVCHRPRAV
mmetsp:Transcript_23128/g.72748  ORF Transcript_23128/g.72748 Transcript_23128/m.72748 type:complete len:276 (-) Transcript_23128:330-1157(-)